MKEHDIDDQGLTPVDPAQAAETAQAGLCPECQGSGVAADGETCPVCDGTGRANARTGGG